MRALPLVRQTMVNGPFPATGKAMVSYDRQGGAHTVDSESQSMSAGSLTPPASAG